jgi:hypothetical protein
MTGIMLVEDEEDFQRNSSPFVVAEDESNDRRCPADGGLGAEIVAQPHDGPRSGVLYASGNISQVRTLAVGDTCIATPYRITDLLRAVRLVERTVRDGVALPPFLYGFHLLEANVSRLWGAAHA